MREWRYFQFERERSCDGVQRIKRINFDSVDYQDDECQLIGSAKTCVQADAQVLWARGMACWERGAEDPNEMAAAFDAFVASIRASPTFAPAFASLGVYYERVEPVDLELAGRCFEKALDIDPGQYEAARFAVDELSQRGLWPLVLRVATEYVEATLAGPDYPNEDKQKLGWGWRTIGTAYLHLNRHPQAISALQSSLRYDHENSHSLVLLGNAYEISGKTGAALKAFSRAVTLAPWSSDAQVHLAALQNSLRISTSINNLTQALIARPNFLPSRILLAQTLLNAGLAELQAGFIVRAEESFISALDHVLEHLDANSAPRLALNLASLALSNLGRLPEPCFLTRAEPLGLQLLAHLAAYDIDQNLPFVNAIRFDALQRSIRFSALPPFFLALAALVNKARVLLESPHPESVSSAWVDLGNSLVALKPHLFTLVLPCSPADTHVQAIRCIKQALLSAPANPAFWNVLGVIALDVCPRLAQHAFITSLELDPHSALVWTNLGFFFLIGNDKVLARAAFERAQLQDPYWAPTKVGLSELSGEKGSRKEMLGFCKGLEGSTLEVELCFAEAAYFKFQASPYTTTPQAALSEPLLALRRYLSLFPTDPTALHLSSLMFERMGDTRSALWGMEKAAASLKKLYQSHGSGMNKARFVISQTNLGRLRLATGNQAGALQAFESALERLPNPLDNVGITGRDGLPFLDSVLVHTECRLGAALALYGMGDVNDAIEQLSEGLEEIDEIEEIEKKAALAICLCRFYWSQGEEERALGSVLDAPDVTRHQSPLFVKLTLKALAILTNDRAFLKTVERVMTRTEVKYNAEVTHLNALEKLIKRDEKGALSIVCRTVHSAPWETAPRRVLAVLLIQSLSLPPKDPYQLLTVCSRFLRPGLIPEEMRTEFPALNRQRKFIGAGTVRMTGEQDLEALAMLEKAIWVAPWGQNSEPRRFIATLVGQ